MSEAPEPDSNVVRLLVGGLDGKLTTADGERLPVRVYERGTDVLMLVLMVNAENELTEPLSLEYVSSRGLVRFHGEAALEGRDLIHFHVQDDPEVLQRREFVRVEAVQPVALRTRDGDALLDTHAIEVSGGGMLITGAASLAPQVNVRFSLHLRTG